MSIWAVVLVTIAVTLLVALPIAGALLFRPARARAVKRAELENVIVVQQRVRELAVHHPEIVRKARIDRHFWYLAPQVGVLGYSLCILAGATVTNNVAVLSSTTRYTMASCFVIGAVLTLVGAAMGARFGRWRFRPKVYDHPTCVLLGDDIATPYRLALAGVGTEAVSLAIYSSTSFATTLGSLGGWLTGALAVLACTPFCVQLLIRIRVFNKEDTALITEALARMGRAHDDVD